MRPAVSGSLASRRCSAAVSHGAGGPAGSELTTGAAAGTAARKRSRAALRRSGSRPAAVGAPDAALGDVEAGTRPGEKSGAASGDETLRLPGGTASTGGVVGPAAGAGRSTGVSDPAVSGAAGATDVSSAASGIGTPPGAAVPAAARGGGPAVP